MSPSGLQSPSQPPPTSPSTLAGGGSPSPDAAPPAGGGEDMAGADGASSALRTAIQSLRKAEMDMMEMAQRFPPAAPSLRQATTAIRAALRQIISNPGQPEPKAPAIGG